ncbi:MAG: ribokinase [Anaerolineales bacterium]
MHNSIVVVGSINMDLVIRSPRLPQLGETLLGGDFHTFPGGKGANQAVACARLGAKVKMIGKVGMDSFGDELLRGLAANGVDINAIEAVPETSTGVALITVVASGDNAIVVSPAANGQITSTDILKYEKLIQGTSVLVLQLEIPLEAVETAIDLARKNGVIVVLNPAPAQPLPEPLLSKVDYIIPNQSELAALTGEQDIKAGIYHLRSRYAGNLMITLGEQGVIFTDNNKIFHLSSYPVQAVDTTAAGDAFVGAFAVGISEGKTLPDAIRMGNAAGALAVQKAGAQPSLPTRAELEKFMQAQHEPRLTFLSEIN